MLAFVDGTTTTTSTSRQDEDEVYHDGMSAALAAMASSILYAITVVRRLRRTAGMEVVGLEYTDSNKRDRHKIVWGAVVSACSAGVLQVCSSWAAARKKRRLQSSTTSSNPLMNLERLTGVSRRQIFEQQRQAMFQRAVTANAANVAGQDQTPKTVASQKGSTSTTVTPRSKFSYSLLWSRVMEALADSSWASASMNGPHEIVQPNGTTTTTTTQPSNAAVRVLQWILRLHLALFCWNGRFPNVWHRLVWKNQTPLQVSGQHRNQPLVENCYSSAVPRVVGLLILAQVAGTALQTISRHWVHRWVEASLLQQVPQQGPRSSIRFDTDSWTDASAPLPKYPFQQHHHQQLRQSPTCAICRQPRRFPACSIHCGHVFCWNCWQQWIETTVPACPLCRRPCRANEVMLLQNYITNNHNNDDDDDDD